MKVRIAIAAAAAACLLCGCPAQLPERETAAGQLYISRCGQCHQPYHPHALTAAMWEKQVEMMEGKMRQVGLPPLSAEDRQSILDYLSRNAGGN